MNYDNQFKIFDVFNGKFKDHYLSTYNYLGESAKAKIEGFTVAEITEIAEFADSLIEEYKLQQIDSDSFVIEPKILVTELITCNMETLPISCKTSLSQILAVYGLWKLIEAHYWVNPDDFQGNLDHIDLIKLQISDIKEYNPLELERLWTESSLIPYTQASEAITLSNMADGKLRLFEGSNTINHKALSQKMNNEKYRENREDKKIALKWYQANRNCNIYKNATEAGKICLNGLKIDGKVIEKPQITGYKLQTVAGWFRVFDKDSSPSMK